MSLPKFVIGMVFALAILVAWSYFDGASLSTTVLRVIGCAVLIQIGYFLLVYVMIARSAPTSADRARDAERGLGAEKASEGEKLSARRSVH
ncbi:exopolysaccharide production repressor exox [Mesorhizobium caraganae]|uniref:exopolysaccharide production repressor exox n=1 Tax=Mesorhizobium caraganae TaxID=483206 RepID=UPI00193A3BEB|nr:exopolysaccharide production repressor exox [Mesorhizobium caraganae]MBM2710750.1 exopolysaccharide production repressor exox [Mesorhizobium caraganae]